MKRSLFTVLASFFITASYAQIGIGTTSPNSTLDVRGSVATNYRAFTASTSASATDNLLIFTGTSACTLTLPTAAGCSGRSYVIKNASTTVPTPLVTIATTSSQTIDGSSSWSLDDAYEIIAVVSNGSNWNIVSQTVPGSGANWGQGGNTVASLKTIGTINNYDLPFITNNTEKMRITSSGNVGIGNTNPTSTLTISGSTAHAITTKTANYTATANDYTILCNNSGGITISLPAASTATGRVYVIKKISGLLSNVTIDPNGSETIEGASTRVLALIFETVTIQCDGSNWYVITSL